MPASPKALNCSSKKRTLWGSLQFAQWELYKPKVLKLCGPVTDPSGEWFSLPRNGLQELTGFRPWAELFLKEVIFHIQLLSFLNRCFVFCLLSFPCCMRTGGARGRWRVSKLLLLLDQLIPLNLMLNSHGENYFQNWSGRLLHTVLIFFGTLPF